MPTVSDEQIVAAIMAMTAPGYSEEPKLRTDDNGALTSITLPAGESYSEPMCLRVQRPD